MKLFISGHGAHGKTTAAGFFTKHFGLKSEDSSDFACERAVYPYMKAAYGYSTPEECYADRRNHRKEWHDLIAAYCQPHDRLARELFETHDIYCGIRSRLEFNASKHLSDLSIWIDASERLPAESTDSMKLTANDFDIVIPNNGDEFKLENRICTLGSALLNNC